MAQFRTKARAVELLGKGQIADLPTAISELWKNGYDAYADTLKCELYLPGYKNCNVLFSFFRMMDLECRKKIFSTNGLFLEPIPKHEAFLI